MKKTLPELQDELEENWIAFKKVFISEMAKDMRKILAKIKKHIIDPIADFLGSIGADLS
jgi:hypothetical protein